MEIPSQFKSEKTFDERLLYSTRLQYKFSDRVPVIIESSGNVKNLDKIKYLVPKSLAVSEIMFIIRKNIKMDSNKAIFIFVNNLLIPMNQNMGEIYYTHKESDGFLYIKYSCENTFG